MRILTVTIILVLRVKLLPGQSNTIKVKVSIENSILRISKLYMPDIHYHLGKQTIIKKWIAYGNVERVQRKVLPSFAVKLTEYESGKDKQARFTGWNERTQHEKKKKRKKKTEPLIFRPCRSGNVRTLQDQIIFIQYIFIVCFIMASNTLDGSTTLFSSYQWKWVNNEVTVYKVLMKHIFTGRSNYSDRTKRIRTNFQPQPLKIARKILLYCNKVIFTFFMRVHRERRTNLTFLIAFLSRAENRT